MRRSRRGAPGAAASSLQSIDRARKEFGALPRGPAADALWGKLLPALDEWSGLVQKVLEVEQRRDALLAGGLASRTPRSSGCRTGSWPRCSCTATPTTRGWTSSSSARTI